VELTDIRISIRDEEKLKAFVTITFDECFVVRGVKIIHGNRGLFVAMPSRRRPDGTFQDIAHPIQSEMRDRLEEEILAAYQEALEAPVSSSTLGH
jgi:stage V sporulation protein G